jgi:hypothetical protein
MQAESHGPTGLLRRKPMIVQPVGPIEAGDLAKTPALLRDWLNRAVARESAEVIAGAAGCDLMVWLPAGQNDPEFVNAVAGQSHDAMPMLRYESPDALAQWLGTRVRGARSNVAILTLEELSGVDNVAKLRMALHDGFYELIGEVVNPAPERWIFSGEMLANQLRDLPTDIDRVIIAVHDLNTGTATPRPEARRELEQKLGAISRVLETAIAAQPKPPKMFRAALLVAKADKLPFVKYPKPSRFEDWCLLPFAQADQGLQPKPVEADMFRGYLREWTLS